jgi:hypothetical protein
MPLHKKPIDDNPWGVSLEKASKLVSFTAAAVVVKLSTSGKAIILMQHNTGPKCFSAFVCCPGGKKPQSLKPILCTKRNPAWRQ